MGNTDALSRLPLDVPTGIENWDVNSFNYTGNFPINMKEISKYSLDRSTYKKNGKLLEELLARSSKNNSELNYYIKLQNNFEMENDCLFYENGGNT